MAIPFANNIDLQKNQILNARFQILTADPSSPVSGQFYFNSVDAKPYIFTTESFKALVVAGSIVNADIAANAAIANSKLATNPLNRANHTGTQVASTISDFNTAVRVNQLDQLATPTGSVSFGSQKITSVANGTNPQDAVTLSQVQAMQAGLDFKNSVRAATTEDIVLAGQKVVDGVSLDQGDRILVKNQSDGTANGIYVVSADAWTRATDADSPSEVTSGMYVYVEEGTSNGGSQWVLATYNPIEVGVTSLTFVTFSGGASYTAGNGLTLTGNDFNIGTASSSRIAINADSIDLALMNSSGIYKSVTVDNYGRIVTGSNPTTLSGYGITNATSKATGYIGNGSSTSITFVHNLGTKEVIAQLRDSSSDSVVITDIVNSTTSGVTFSFSVAPATNAYRCVVIG